MGTCRTINFFPSKCVFHLSVGGLPGYFYETQLRHQCVSSLFEHFDNQLNTKKSKPNPITIKKKELFIICYGSGSQRYQKSISIVPNSSFVRSRTVGSKYANTVQWKVNDGVIVMWRIHYPSLLRVPGDDPHIGNGATNLCCGSTPALSPILKKQNLGP